MSRVRMLIALFLVLSVLVFAVPYSYSGVPQTINYQGVLANTNGTPVPNGNYDVEFKIYNMLSGGTALWTETWNSGTSQVTVVNGVFNVILGKYYPIPPTLFAEQSTNTLYLGIKVGSIDSEMSPRQQITSVAYAFTAGTAFTAGNGIPQGVIVMWSGQTIPSGWALCDGSNGTPDLRDKFVLGAGTTYSVGTTGGEATHVLTTNEMPSHTHIQNAHTHIQDAHNHGLVTEAGDTQGAGVLPNRNGPGNVDQLTQNATATNQATTPTNQNTGGGAAHNNMPPYYALAFIMKL